MNLDDLLQIGGYLIMAYGSGFASGVLFGVVSRFIEEITR